MTLLAKPLLVVSLAAAAVLFGDAAPAGAETPASRAESAEARVCRAGTPPDSLPAMEAFARLQSRLAAEAAASGEAAPIVLNGRGYNYAASRDPVRELQVLQAERARARR